MMKSLLPLILAGVAIPGWAQSPPAQPPRFEDYRVQEVFKGEPALPVLESPEERKFAAVIGDGVSKGWGAFDGVTGKEFRRPGPNFAGAYVIVNFGCASQVSPVVPVQRLWMQRLAVFIGPLPLAQSPDSSSRPSGCLQ
jgi:hypothetical protein